MLCRKRKTMGVAEMGKYVYMTAKCDICLKVVAAEVFEKGSDTESFLNKYERDGYVVEECKTPPMIEGCQCKQELARLRAALGQIPPEPFAGTCVWKKAGTPSKDNIYNTSCGVVRCLPQDGICPCCNRRVEVKS